MSLTSKFLSLFLPPSTLSKISEKYPRVRITNGKRRRVAGCVGVSPISLPLVSRAAARAEAPPRTHKGEGGTGRGQRSLGKVPTPSRARQPPIQTRIRHRTKRSRFNPRSRRRPGSWPRSPVGGVQEPATQAGALTGNRTHDLLVPRMTLKPLSHWENPRAGSWWTGSGSQLPGNGLRPGGNAGPGPAWERTSFPQRPAF